ncbi:hypothetical protein FNAPI_6773 [Fusarium napiforme]|uniref:Uncharacterized protein n=1 Tax=Fusarium napiforme TaxID=42672 RepID=A0A8H5JDJ3_9HYPO|nr:hypothetical protein FNAPI_6773 [Fusarium napiforme]
MANDNDKEKTQNVPKLKAKAKDDDKQLMTNVIGQQPIDLADGGTGQLTRNQIYVVTGFKGNTTYIFSAATADDAREAIDDILSKLKPALKPGVSLTCQISLPSVQDGFHKNAKRKRPTLDYDDEEDTAARRSARRAREALWQQANQRDSGQRSGQDQGQTDDNSQRRPLCVGCKSDKHTLAECLKASADGYMKGCPLCNTMDHNAGDCLHPALKNNKLLSVRYFTNNRRNMPSFLDIKAWYPLVSKIIPQSDLRQDSQFPWTPEFTKSIVGCIDDLQRKVEEKGLGEVKLPVDPTVNGWSAVVAYHQRLEKDEKEKALAEARAKVVPLSDLQKAVVAFLAQETIGGYYRACRPPGRLRNLAGANEQHDASQRRPWDGNSRDGGSDDDDDNDDDDDDEDMDLRNLNKSRAKKLDMRAKSHASVL